MRSLFVWTLLAGMLALAAAAGSSAFSQPRVGGSARSTTATQSNIVFVTAVQAHSSHTCQETRPNRQTVRRGKLIPIACEQPPRMNLSPGSTLAKAAAVDGLG